MLNVDLIERNERAFNGIKRSNQALKHSFLYTLVNWVRVFIEDHTLSMIDFIEWPYVKLGERLFVFFA